MLTKEQMYCLTGLVADLNAADLDEENNNELCWKAADALEDTAATVIEQQAEIERLRGIVRELIEMMDYDKSSERYRIAVDAAYEEVDQ